MLFGTWLRSVRARQQDEGVDHRELATHASALTPYVKDRLFSAIRVMESVYIRIPPEPLNDAEQRFMWEELREDYITEVRKALDLVACTLTVVGCTDEELGDAFQVDETPEEIDDAQETESKVEAEEDEMDNETTVKMPVLADTLVGEKKTEK